MTIAWLHMIAQFVAIHINMAVITLLRDYALDILGSVLLSDAKYLGSE